MANSSSSSTTTPLEPEKECHYLSGFVWKKSYLTDETYGILVAITRMNSITVLPTILLNVLTILAVASKERLQTTSHVLLACLAGIDLFGVVTAHSIGIAIEIKRILGDGPFCDLEKAFTVICIGGGFAVVGQIVLTSIDRYIAIKHPLRYREMVSRRRVKYALILNMSVAAVVTIQETVLAVIDSGSKEYVTYIMVKDSTLVVICFIYVAVICYTYRYIFSETWRQMKRLKTEQLSSNDVKRLKKENKAANTLALGLLLLFYLPAMTAGTMFAVSHDILEPPAMLALWSLVFNVSLLSGLFHPIIYCWRSKKLRQAFLEILHLRQPENAPPPIEMQVIERHQPQILPTKWEPFSRNQIREEPVLRSVRPLEADLNVERIQNDP